MSPRAVLCRRSIVMVAVLAATVSCAAEAEPVRHAPPGPAAETVRLPPMSATVDYQLGGAYEPRGGTDIVVRDRADSPLPDVYSICYVNAFQAQPGAMKDWEDDLILRDASGAPVVDHDWDEALLDISTADRRERIAAQVSAWIDGCADAGYDAVEPDNYDSYTRSDERLTAEHAKAMIALLVEHAHARGLAIAQKNTAELAADRQNLGLDFAVVEECARYDECAAYVEHFGPAVIVVEYTDDAFESACRDWDDLSIVRRDVDVTTPDDEAYVHRRCPPS